MAQTKKDFEFVASVLASRIEEVNDAPVGAASYAALLTLQNTAREFSRRFQATNPRFDGARFLKACGVKL